jgi:hypothetical protein
MTDTAATIAASDDGSKPERRHAAAVTVSARTDKVLREAIERLLAGKSQHTDGRLIKENLWKEAKVSRATMNRAPQIIAEWNARVAERGGLTADQARHTDELAKLRRKLADKAQTATQLRRQLDAAATVIAALHHDNIALREQLDRRGGLVDLHTRRSQPRQSHNEPET